MSALWDRIRQSRACLAAAPVVLALAAFAAPALSAAGITLWVGRAARQMLMPCSPQASSRRPAQTGGGGRANGLRRDSPLSLRRGNPRSGVGLCQSRRK